MDETSNRTDETPDANEPTQEPGDAARPGAGQNPPQANHPDAPDKPTTPYDHIWYDRRPLH